MVPQPQSTLSLRCTADGIEIHVDGEMLEPGLHGDSALHAGHGAMHKRAEALCKDGGPCEMTVWLSAAADMDIDRLSGMDHEVPMMHDAYGDAEEHSGFTPAAHAEKIISIRHETEIN
jgi:hypothetical protein